MRMQFDVSEQEQVNGNASSFFCFLQNLQCRWWNIYKKKTINFDHMKILLILRCRSIHCIKLLVKFTVYDFFSIGKPALYPNWFGLYGFFYHSFYAWYSSVIYLVDGVLSHWLLVSPINLNQYGRFHFQVIFKIMFFQFEYWFPKY